MAQLDLFGAPKTLRQQWAEDAAAKLNPTVPAEDVSALDTSLRRVLDLMRDGQWHDADEICRVGGRSAVRRLWDLGQYGHRYAKERVPGRRPLYRYRLIASPTNGVS